jgi:hypothetical protein
VPYRQLDAILSKVKANGTSNPFTESDHHDIMRLIQENPELAKCSFQLRFRGYVPFRRTYINVLPLFHVCQAYCPHAVIQAVFLAYKSALYKVDGTGSTPLLRLCGRLLADARQERDMDDTLRYFAEEQPSAFGIPRSRTPLHILCSHQAPLSAIMIAAMAYPRALLRKDQLSRQTPLHLACSISTEKMDPRVIDYLITACPESVHAKDVEGKLPLHCASRSSKMRYSIIQRLVQAYPEAIREQMKGKMDTPLHLACYYPSDDKWIENIRVVKLMVDVCPDVLNTRTKSGIRPLDRAKMQQAPQELLALLQPKETA